MTTVTLSFVAPSFSHVAVPDTTAIVDSVTDAAIDAAIEHAKLAARTAENERRRAIAALNNEIDSLAADGFDADTTRANVRAERDRAGQAMVDAGRIADAIEASRDVLFPLIAAAIEEADFDASEEDDA